MYPKAPLKGLFGPEVASLAQAQLALSIGTEEYIILRRLLLVSPRFRDCKMGDTRASLRTSEHFGAARGRVGWRAARRSHPSDRPQHPRALGRGAQPWREF